MKTKIVLLATMLFSLARAQDPMGPLRFHADQDRFRAVLHWEFRSGDDPVWALPAFSDTSWTRVRILDHTTERSGSHWYRTRIQLTGMPSQGKTLMVLLVGLYRAYEVHWDGNLIGRNGRVGLEETDEIPGTIKAMFTLPQGSVEPGDHTLAIRMSNHRGNLWFPRNQIVFGYLTDWQAYVTKVLNREFLMIGIYFTTVILSLALYLGGGRHRSFLFVGVFSLTTAASYAVAPLIEYVRMGIAAHDYIIGLQYINFYLTPFLWIAFLLFHFSIPRKRFHFGFIALVALLSVFLFWPRLNVNLFTSVTIFYALGLLIHAVRRKEPGSVMALIGILFLTLSASRYALQAVFHIVVLPVPSEYFTVPFLFCLTLSIGQQIRAQARIHTATLKRSHRLETELLKKTIQPHFMMNTLISIIALIGEDPKKAVRLIKALASEFRMINRISAKKLIPLAEEIDLCRMHLELMGYRMDAKYDFIQDEVCEEESVPPMIFHTLVENGLTHAYDVGQNGTFTLTCMKRTSGLQYRLRNDGPLLPEFAARSASEIEEGMGLKYVRARLEESYPLRWDLVYGMNGKHWEVLITIEK